MDLASLKQNFQGEITTHEADIEKYSRDASLFEIAPQAILFPRNIHDVEALVKYVSMNKAMVPDLSITPRGGGTDMTGGSINNSLLIDMTKHFNRILDLTNDSVTTESGVMFRNLEVRLTAKNRMMPSYPVSKMLASVGGMVGNNSGGEKTFSYGQVKDFVEELEMILSDGKAYTIKPLTEGQLKAKMMQRDFEGEFYSKIFKLINDNYRLLQSAKPTTSKNSSGYFLWDVWDGKTFDLTKLFVGSQGTLGIVTKIKWRIVPIKRKSRLVVFFLDDLSKLGEVVSHVAEIHPESFEIYDEHSFKLGLRYMPEILAKMKGSKIKLLFNFLPEFWMMLTHGLPKVVLMAEFTGDDMAEVTTRAESAMKNIKDHFNLAVHITKGPEEDQKYWTMRRESYNLLREHNARKVSAPFIEDIVVHPSQLPEFMPKLNEILSHYPDFIYTIAGHAGDANFHIIPLMDLDNQKNRDQIVEIADKVFGLVLSFKGSMTGEHNDGLVRGPFLKKMHGEKVYQLFKQTKQIFDPLNIFNPHKKTDADLKFYVDHIKHNGEPSSKPSINQLVLDSEQ